MLLQEIKDQIPNATPTDLVNLANEFYKILNKLSEFHKDYLNFLQEYYHDILGLTTIRDSSIREEFLYYVETTIEIGERLKNN